MRGSPKRRGHEEKQVFPDVWEQWGSTRLGLVMLFVLINSMEGSGKGDSDTSHFPIPTGHIHLSFSMMLLMV